MAPADVRVLTALRPTRKGDTCASVAKGLGTTAGALEYLSPGLSCQ
jgi:hypothetical protein